MLKRENPTLTHLILLRLEAKLPDQRSTDLNFYGYSHDEVMTQIGWLVDQGCVTAKPVQRTLFSQVSRHFVEPNLTERGRTYLERLREQYQLWGR
jgi:hypothetical protein